MKRLFGYETQAIEIEGVDALAAHRRALSVLRLSSTFSRGAVSASFPVSVLAIKGLLGSETWAGLATGASTLGSALAAGWLAAFMQRRGRTPGLALGLGTAVLGAIICIVAIQAGVLPLFLAGMILVGVGAGTSNMSRYAAADLASDATRSRDIGSVVFFATFGAVLAPSLIGGLGDIAESLGLDSNAGGFLLAVILFGLSSLVIWFFMRPDPLIVSGGVNPDATVKKRAVPFREALAIAWAHPLARLAFVALVVSQAVMVMVMAMTPLHMEDHGHTKGWIGAVISAHTAGMFAFAPLAGRVSDGLGRVPTIVLAGLTLVGATTLTALAGEAPRGLLFPGLFLLGLGWSFGVVAGSALLTESVKESDRVAVQGAADLATNVASGVGALTAGVVLSSAGYHILSLIGMTAAGILMVQSWYQNRMTGIRPA
ncbi:MAG: MFS family permease [Candidatus Aldehydirespiratoraceae bacterium]|jgi:MFS family permease